MLCGNRLARLAVGSWFGALALGCGGDDCDGFVRINASPEECRVHAERRGCPTIEIDGPTCGLFGCVRCSEDDDPGQEPS